MFFGGILVFFAKLWVPYLNLKPHWVAGKKNATTLSQLSDEKSTAERFSWFLLIKRQRIHRFLDNKRSA